MSKYRSFIFESYSFSNETKILSLRYSFDKELEFEETFKFDFEFVEDIDEKLLDRAFLSLFLMAGVSYYKAYLPEIINTESLNLDQEMANFFSKTYQKGLGEFFYINKLDPKTPIVFKSDGSPWQKLSVSGQNGKLVGVGGGKDSLVTVELLRKQGEDIATWSVGHRSQLTPLVKEIGLTHYFVERTWDKKLLELNKQGAMNGHIPISAIFACVGMVVAALTGHKDIVVSNEQSANEPTLNYKNTDINHQYSKSQEFEKDFQKLLAHLVGDGIRYYSFLRSLSEVRIAELFAQTGFEKYKGVFSSCNEAFVHTSTQMSWCGECPKCAFVFLALTPFVDRSELESLWGGKNLLLDTNLEPTYRKLLGIEGDKPFDCVGEVKEVRTAMRLAEKKYPELGNKYHFEIPSDYNYAELSTNELPSDIAKTFTESIAGLQPLGEQPG